MNWAVIRKALGIGINIVATVAGIAPPIIKQVEAANPSGTGEKKFAEVFAMVLAALQAKASQPGAPEDLKEINDDGVKGLLEILFQLLKGQGQLPAPAPSGQQVRIVGIMEIVK